MTARRCAECGRRRDAGAELPRLAGGDYRRAPRTVRSWCCAGCVLALAGAHRKAVPAHSWYAKHGNVGEGRWQAGDLRRAADRLAAGAAAEG